MTPLILTAAVTGGGPRGPRAPHLPVTPDEVVHEALQAWRAGAAIVHLHGRTDAGEPTADPAVHRRLLTDLRAAGCDAIVNFSTGDGGGRFDHGQRLALIDCGSEMVSFTASSYHSGHRLYDNRPDYLAQVCARMKAAGVRPEIEVIDTGFLDRIGRMVAAGDLRAPLYCLLAFGIPGGMPADADLLPVLLRRLPADAHWGLACAADPATVLDLQMRAFALGGHIRVGMEDHAWLRDGQPATGNAQLIEPWVRTAQAFGRPLATPAQARKILGIERG